MLLFLLKVAVFDVTLINMAKATLASRSKEKDEWHGPPGSEPLQPQSTTAQRHLASRLQQWLKRLSHLGR
jgi:hypothetical protein